MKRPRLLNLRYAGTCAVCSGSLQARTRAWWFTDTKQIVCTSCSPADVIPAASLTSPSVAGEDASADEANRFAHPPSQPETPAAPPDDAPLTTVGEAGASARREGSRRADKRARETLARHPSVGKLLLAVTDEPQSVRSWKKGAVGEEALGARLNALATERLVVLHDRRIPGSRANIDHIVVAPGGVFVIDAKHYGGQVERRNVGNVFRKDIRVYVGRRDCTKLVQGSEDQAEVVRSVLSPLGFVDVPVRPVLCFIGAEWGMFASPFKVGHVLVSWPKFLYELLAKDDEVQTAVVQEVARGLAAALRAA